MTTPEKIFTSNISAGLFKDMEMIVQPFGLLSNSAKLKR